MFYSKYFIAFTVFYIGFCYNSISQTPCKLLKLGEYNIEISYNHCITRGLEKKRNRCPNDSLPLIFESGFSGDVVEISTNNTVIIRDSLSSNESTGLAKLIYLRDYKNINNIGIRINKGKLCFVETNKGCHYIGIRFPDRKTLKVVFYDKVPHFY